MLACIRDVGGGKLRIHTYRTGRRGHLATESRKRHFDPPPLAGATSRENFRTKTAVANPVEPDHRQGADGSLASTPERISRRRETSALPPPHLGAGSPSVSVWCLCPSSVQSSPSPPAHSPYPSMQEEKIPTSTSIGHATPLPSGGVWPRVPASRHSSTASQRRRSKNRTMYLGTLSPARLAKSNNPAEQAAPHPDTWMEKPGRTDTHTHAQPTHARSSSGGTTASNNKKRDHHP